MERRAWGWRDDSPSRVLPISVCHSRNPVVFPLTGRDVSRLSGFDFEEGSGEGAGAFVKCTGGVRHLDALRFLLPHDVAGRSEQRHEQRLQRESNGATLHERLPRLM